MKVLRAITLNMPPSCRNLRDAGKLLHKWRSYLQASGCIAFVGGLFQHLDASGKSQFHAHLTLLSDLPNETLSNTWKKLTRLPKWSCVIKPIYDFDGWLNYAFSKNVNEAVKWRVSRYREEFLQQAGIFQ